MKAQFIDLLAAVCRSERGRIARAAVSILVRTTAHGFGLADAEISLQRSAASPSGLSANEGTE